MSGESEEILVLIRNVKENGDNDSFIKLYDIYEKLCYEMAHKVNFYKDFNNDIRFLIFNSILKYDETRGYKFSTFLSNVVKNHCLQYHISKRKDTIYNSEDIFNDNLLNSEFNDNIQNNEELKFNNYFDLDANTTFNKITSIVNNFDSQTKKIFELRYFNGFNGKLMPWRKIAEEIGGISGQACLNIHNKAIKQIRMDIPDFIHDFSHES